MSDTCISGRRKYTRNREIKTAASSRCALNPNLSSMHFYQALGNRQAQPGAPLFDLDRFASIKPFKDLGLFNQGNAAPGVGDAKLHEAALVGPGLDTNLSALLSELHGVLNKVGENLMELIPIGVNRHRLAVGDVL